MPGPLELSCFIEAKNGKSMLVLWCCSFKINYLQQVLRLKISNRYAGRNFFACPDCQYYIIRARPAHNRFSNEISYGLGEDRWSLFSSYR